ncbi:MAG: CopD family protein [Gammaproteobacteria bacterium]
MHPLYIALTAIDVIAVVAGLGMIAGWLWVLPRDQDPIFHRSFWRLEGVSLLFLTLSSALILVSRSLEMSGGPFSGLPQVIPEVLQATRFGSIWWFRPPLLLALWLLWLLGFTSSRRARWVGILMFIALAGVAFTRSETGHPADHGDFRLGVFVDWLHLLAAGLWIGALFCVTLVIFPALRRRMRERRPDLAADIFQRLSSLAGWGLALILVTGIWTAWKQLGTWSALFNTAYGQILLVKLSLVALLIVIGAYNRFIRLPRIRHAHGWDARSNRWVHWAARMHQVTQDECGQKREIKRCYRAVAIESLIGVAVLVAASVLLHGMPPVAMVHVPAGFGTVSANGRRSGFGSDPASLNPSMSMASTMPISARTDRSTPRIHFSFGESGRVDQVTQTIRIRALDTMRFSPAIVHVQPGQTVRFRVTDAGRLDHEFVIGSAREQKKHEKEMEAHPDMPMHDPNGITLKPGQTRSILWRFPDHPMRLEYACHEPGHFAAGMIGQIVVGQPGSTD